MKYGLLYANVGPFAGPEGLRELAQSAESAGFDSIWAVEHAAFPVEFQAPYPYTEDGRLPLPPTTEIADPLLALAYAAAVTTRLKLATGVLLLAQRHPIHVAKAVATLDRLSEGRAILGVGLGWLREEYELFGNHFRSRVGRTEEAIRALRALWEERPLGFGGRFFQWPAIEVHPKPFKAASVPVVIGGCVEASARRAARIGDGFCPVQVGPDELAALLAAMSDECARLGRPVAEIEVTVGATELDPESIARYRDLGVQRLLVPPPTLDPSELGSRLREFGTRVIQRLESIS